MNTLIAGRTRGRARRYGIAAVAIAIASTVAACGSTSAGSPSAAAAIGNSKLHAMLPASIRQSGVLRVGDTNSEPPFDYVQNNTLTGFDIDFANALASQLGIKAEFDPTNFNGLIAGEQAGRWEVIISAMTDTSAREKQVTFLDYLNDGTTVVVPKGNPKGITSITQICGLTFADFQGSTYSSMIASLSKQYCTSRGKPAAKTLLFADLPSTFEAVASGRANAVMEGLATSAYEIKQVSGQLETTPILLGALHIGIALKPQDTQLLRALEAAFNAIIKNGTYQKLVKKWDARQAAVTSGSIVNHSMGL